jgi:hypothetical protein
VSRTRSYIVDYNSFSAFAFSTFCRLSLLDFLSSLTFGLFGLLGSNRLWLFTLLDIRRFLLNSSPLLRNLPPCPEFSTLISVPPKQNITRKQLI